MKHLFKAVLLAFMVAALSGCSGNSDFVHVRGGNFIRHGKPYRFIGTNFWYGPILASDGCGGDYDRLVRELDTLKALGVENLRVLVGCDGPEFPTRVKPTLQYEPGVYNDTLLVGMDRFLVELGKRDMQAVLYLNNSWEWSGGYGQYLQWATGEEPLLPGTGYIEFIRQMSKFNNNPEAQELFYNYVRDIVGRVNSITGKPYKDDPAIFSWQICNEPRRFAEGDEKREGFIRWMTESARIIKEIDPNHMVSTGDEGIVGAEEDEELLRIMNTIPGVDYMTIHIWPYNWQWAAKQTIDVDIDKSIFKTDDYIMDHVKLARKLRRPIVLEEFGYPRDRFSLDLRSSTKSRDRYYEHIFNLVVDGRLDGANFWGWSGFAEKKHDFWEKWDDVAGDPPQEAQGLNGVYITDSTVGVVKKAADKLR